MRFNISGTYQGEPSTRPPSCTTPRQQTMLVSFSDCHPELRVFTDQKHYSIHVCEIDIQRCTIQTPTFRQFINNKTHFYKISFKNFAIKRSILL